MLPLFFFSLFPLATLSIKQIEFFHSQKKNTPQLHIEQFIFIFFLSLFFSSFFLSLFSAISLRFLSAQFSNEKTILHFFSLSGFKRRRLSDSFYAKR